MVSLETEMRKLRPANLSRLAELLSPSLWKTVMGNIKKPGSPIVPMFTSEHIAMIETAAMKQRKSASEIFLDEWGTMGRKRPTIRATIDLLVETELFRAADYLAVEVLNGTAPNRPADGPAAAIEIPADLDGCDHQNNTSQGDYNCNLNLIETMDNPNMESSTFSRDSTSDIAITDTKIHGPITKNQDLTSFPSDTNADPIQFSSSNISTEREKERSDKRMNSAPKYTDDTNDSTIPPASLLPNLSSLRLDNIHEHSTQKKEQTRHLPYYPQELASSELPLCINERTVKSSNGLSSCDSDDSISCTDSLISSTAPSNPSGSNSPVMTIERGELWKQKHDIQNNSSPTNLIDHELPLTVLELCKK